MQWRKPDLQKPKYWQGRLTEHLEYIAKQRREAETAARMEAERE